MVRKSWLPRFICVFCAWLWLAASPSARAQTLYDAGAGTLPQAQGWSFGAFGIVADVVTNGSVLLDTTAANSTQAGWSAVTVADLNRTNGFTLLFTARLNA